MSDLPITFIIAWLIIMVILYQSIVIVAENERVAVFFLGRFQAYKGPGLVFVTPHTQKIVRLKVGDIGVLSNAEFARFDDMDIPVQDVGSLRQGQAVRIERFDGVQPRLAASNLPAQTICPNCGHKF